MGENTGKVFDGINVVDFGTVGVGPWMCKYFAEHGAQVIRVESKYSIDIIRASTPYKDDIAGVDRSGFFPLYNNDKYGVTLNLKHPKGLEVAKKIVAWADIVVEGYTPGTMKRLGLGYEELKEIKPDIIMLSTCNQGQTGPHAQQPGVGVQLTALSGFVHLTGWPDRGSSVVWGAHTDVTAMSLGLPVLIAALDYRRRTGKGQYLDLSQYESGVVFIAPLVLEYVVNDEVSGKMGNRCPYAAPHGAYPCRGQDRWCAIAVFSDEEWEGFCQTIGNPDWTRNPKFVSLLSRKENEDELDRLVGEWTCGFTAEQVMAMMQAASVPAGVVQNCQDLDLDPHLKYRQHSKLKHPVIGEQNYPSPPFRLSKTPSELKMPAPCLGQHNEYVYTKIIGLSDEEFLALLSEGVFE